MTSFNEEENNPVDVSYIDVAEEHRLGSNTVTGNRALSPVPPRVGENLCIFNPTVDISRCGKIIPAPNSRFFMSPETAGNPGQSGAPVWSAEELVGIYLGTVKSAKTGRITASRILPWAAVPRSLQLELGLIPTSASEGLPVPVPSSTLGSSTH